jgi:membrane-bound lytic murein transglycosylase D
LNFSKKYRVTLLAVCLLLGASAAILAGKTLLTNTNIFARTQKECPGVKWINPVDSANLKYPVEITGDLDFAGERVPLEDPEVKERLERELLINTNWHSNTLLCMKMANRYFPDIEKTLADSGLPDDFKYMALIESTFRLEASPAGAAGFWQFVKGTAEKYHMEINEQVDERYNVEKSTAAACAFLKEAKEKLGNWTLAAASYNMGLGGMMSRVKEQRLNNYYDMYFNPETSRYVFRMLAMKIIFSNPKKAGYLIQPNELYLPYKYKVVEVDTGIANIADFAAQFGLKYKHLKTLNPWMRDAMLTNRTHKQYEIKIMEQPQ